MRTLRTLQVLLPLVALAACTRSTPVVTATPAPGESMRPAPASAMPLQPAMVPAGQTEQLVGDLERQRKNVLDYVNVAPDSMLTFRSTPGVRTYAQQIHHIASANAGILGRAFGAAPLAAADTTLVFRDKAALRDYVNASYDYAVRIVRDAQPAMMMKETTLFGMTRTGTRWVDGVMEHGTWTLGQTVPYLRMNRVTPPNYLPF